MGWDRYSLMSRLFGLKNDVAADLMNFPVAPVPAQEVGKRSTA
jgi:hypothetical protein